MAKTVGIPLLLLKTESSPHDAYREIFSQQTDTTNRSNAWCYSTHFVPVLSHARNAMVMHDLAEMLRKGTLKQKYGGMIFTSQRAVEAWIEAVHSTDLSQGTTLPPRVLFSDPFADLYELTRFPLYVVGPATERALSTLLATTRQLQNTPFRKLNATIHGADSGNGANLAQFILGHYNLLYRDHWFSYYEAPRLPFIPLLGMSSQNYGRKRLEQDDPKLQKKPLCFLVGETRRDIIPRTLQAAEDRIEVDEVEVYTTQVLGSLEQSLTSAEDSLLQQIGPGIRIVVVFSPQGSEVMLRHIGWLDQHLQPTDRAKQRWWHTQQPRDQVREDTRWIVATIGPTTRDFLKDRLNIDPDISALKPTPASLRVCIDDFLREHVQKVIS